MAQLLRSTSILSGQQRHTWLMPAPSAVPCCKKALRSRLLRYQCNAMRNVDEDILASGCPVPTEQQPIQELKQLQVRIASCVAVQIL